MNIIALPRHGRWTYCLRIPDYVAICFLTREDSILPRQPRMAPPTVASPLMTSPRRSRCFLRRFIICEALMPRFSPRFLGTAPARAREAFIKDEARIYNLMARLSASRYFEDRFTHIEPAAIHANLCRWARRHSDDYYDDLRPRHALLLFRLLSFLEMPAIIVLATAAVRLLPAGHGDSNDALFKA